jgi:hypothetical protein
MGFFIHGVKPKNKKKEYLDYNCWYWRPLWEYVHEVCKDILTEKDFKGGETNDFYFIDADKTKKIAARLETLLKEGKVDKYSYRRQERLDNLPDEVCDSCDGAKEVQYLGKEYKEECRNCGGTGYVRPFECRYPFYSEIVEEFVEFCNNVEGFTIG